MARMDQDLEASGLVRMLIYGPPKSRKTWWALRAAELGFNVLLLDFEDGAGIAKNLSPGALKRIYRMDLRPNADGYDTSGAAAVVYAMSGQTVFFDEAKRKYVPRARLEDDVPYAKLDFSLFGPDTVVVIDTWTAFSQQLTANTVTVTNPTAISKLEWEDYAKIRLVVDNFLNNALRLRCHLIVVGHSETYAKKKPTADPKAPLREQVESVRLQPTSVTRAHAETMAGKFQDVLYFEIPNSLQGTMISTKGSEEFDAGSRAMAPGIYKFADFDPAVFFAKAHLEAVASNMEFSTPGLVSVTKAEFDAGRAEQSAKPASITVGDKPATLNLKRNLAK